ncbi:MAG: MmcQ/YjbR family DNA-binding protein [Christensenellaceae bacterium]|jgi:predicted DNA-binding protein (MmcQ/YjbR family)|nr:MmcQ/YjbR family DNA-binding protein [Christensenellaceae bacterium]
MLSREEILEYCLKKPGAYLDFPFGPIYPVVKLQAPSQAKGRMFAQPFALRGQPLLTLNCSPAAADFYRSVYPGSVTRGYHCPPVQQPHFNTVSLLGAVPDGEILVMIDEAFSVVLGKLPKAAQKELRGL